MGPITRHLIFGNSHMRESPKSGALIQPKTVGLLLQGHPQIRPPIYRNSHVYVYIYTLYTWQEYLQIDRLMSATVSVMYCRSISRVDIGFYIVTILWVQAPLKGIL